MDNNTGLEYKMPKKMFNYLLESRTEEEKKKSPYAFVTDYVNTHFGLKGTVKNIIVA